MSFFKPAIVEAADGSAKTPSVFASRRMASKISTSDTAMAVPFESLIAFRARWPRGGSPIRMSIAKVFGSLTDSIVSRWFRKASTIGQHPSAWTPVTLVIGGRMKLRKDSSWRPFQIIESNPPVPMGVTIRWGACQSSCSQTSYVMVFSPSIRKGFEGVTRYSFIPLCSIGIDLVFRWSPKRMSASYAIIWYSFPRFTSDDKKILAINPDFAV